jgi:hypothetical protein
VFDPLDHSGLPIDRHGRHWHELDVEPVDAWATDPYTRCRISTMEALEAASALFDRQLTRRIPDADARRSVGSLGEWAAERRHRIAALQPQAPAPPARTDSALQNAIGHERAALDLVTWVARNEPEPDRSLAYQRQAWRHLKHLRSYAELSDRAGFEWAPRIAGEVDELRPASATGSAPMWHRGRQPSDERPATVNQPLSVLYDWAVWATHQQVARHCGGVAQRLLEPITAQEAPETRTAHQRRRGWRPDTGAGGWELLVVHESAACYLYYSFLAEETDPRLKAVWELHLQMELAQLRAAGDLLRRYADRDPQEVTGTGLPEPVTLGSNGRYLSDQSTGDTAGAGPQSADVARPIGLDLVDLLTEQHARIERLFPRAIRAAGDDRDTALGELARLIAVHEIVEAYVVHPLIRRLDPDEHLADRMLDEERRISDALADALRADVAGDSGEVIGVLHDMVQAHARHEERDEFPQLREALPAEDLRQMTGAVRAAEEAAAADAGPGEDPAGAEPQALPQTAERVRDALRTVA